jgi:hypothetical protein
VVLCPTIFDIVSSSSLHWISLVQRPFQAVNLENVICVSIYLFINNSNIPISFSIPPSVSTSARSVALTVPTIVCVHLLVWTKETNKNKFENNNKILLHEWCDSVHPVVSVPMQTRLPIRVATFQFDHLFDLFECLDVPLGITRRLKTIKFAVAF